VALFSNPSGPYKSITGIFLYGVFKKWHEASARHLAKISSLDTLNLQSLNV
jgi:hypothetical protein